MYAGHRVSRSYSGCPRAQEAGGALPEAHGEFYLDDADASDGDSDDVCEGSSVCSDGPVCWEACMVSRPCMRGGETHMGSASRRMIALTRGIGRTVAPGSARRVNM